MWSCQHCQVSLKHNSHSIAQLLWWVESMTCVLLHAIKINALHAISSLRARFIKPTWAHLGPTGPRWAPSWPHELCYLGCYNWLCYSNTWLDSNCKIQWFLYYCPFRAEFMMRWWYGNTFCMTDPLWGESIGYWWIPLKRPSNAELDVFFDANRNMLLNKELNSQWFQTQWRSCNVTGMICNGLTLIDFTHIL